jgi:FemAB-related protein (PEP-CTERM system-associated)
LADSARELAGKLDVDYLELRNRKPLLAGWPTKTSYVTFRKSISANSEENLKAIPRKQRAMVRKAMKYDLRAEQDADVGRLFRVLSECKRNLGTPFFGEEYLAKVKDVFGPQCEVMTVTREGEPICSVMNFRFRDEILPYYGGGTASARTCAGNDFMYWQVMESASRSGCRIFDYGRSTENTGPYDFKKNWGFIPEPLHYQYFLVNASCIPNLSPSNRKYQIFIKAWKKLPLWLANLVGPSLARRLG